MPGPGPFPPPGRRHPGRGNGRKRHGGARRTRRSGDAWHTARGRFPADAGRGCASLVRRHGCLYGLPREPVPVEYASEEASPPVNRPSVPLCSHGMHVTHTACAEVSLDAWSLTSPAWVHDAVGHRAATAHPAAASVESSDGRRSAPGHRGRTLPLQDEVRAALNPIRAPTETQKDESSQAWHRGHRGHRGHHGRGRARCPGLRRPHGAGRPGAQGRNVRASGVESRDRLAKCRAAGQDRPESHAVDAPIGRPRRRLGPPDPVRTVRGTGYRLVGTAPRHE